MGLAGGAYYADKLLKKYNITSLYTLQLTLGLLSLIYLGILMIFKVMYVWPVLIHLLFILMTIGIAFITGLIFSRSTKLSKYPLIEISAKNYSIDLIGSAIGVFITTVFLIPVIGIIGTLLFLTVLNIFISIILRLKEKRYFL